MMPAALRGDFQDLAAWRAGVHEVLDLLLRTHDGPVVVPMTLVDPRYVAEILGRLRDDGHDVRHVSLLAERATVLRRLRRRGLLGLRREAWAVERVDRLLDALARPEFAEHVHTDRLSIAQVGDRVAHAVGLAVGPAEHRVRAGLRHLDTTARHVRL